MTPKLSSDVEHFISGAPDGAIKIEGVTGATYWVMTEEAMQIRHHVLQGLKEADRGDVALWNTEEVKAEGRRLKKERSAHVTD